MPWEEPLQKIQNSLMGPVAKIVGVIVLIAAAFTIAVTKGQSIAWLFWIVLALAIVFNAIQLLDLLFPTASGYILSCIGGAV
jgi:type IV secretion system protein VirB2